MIFLRPLVRKFLMLKVRRLSPHATLPTIGHPGEDIGYDLYASENVVLSARSAAGVPTGIAIEFDPPAGAVVKTRVRAWPKSVSYAMPG